MVAEVGSAVFGLGVALGLGEAAVRLVLWRVEKDIKLPAPSELVAKKWKQVVKGNEGGAWIGRLERTLYLFAFCALGGTGAAAVVAAWLAFKVAAKWQAWTQTVALPETLDGVDPMDYLVARRRWGSHVLSTFLVGTLSNVLFGLAGGWLAHGGDLVAALGLK